jgi:hypothetical protein
MFVRKTVVVAVGALSVFSVAACSGGDDTDSQTALSGGSANPRDLRGACPDPIVIQTDWNPESEYGGLYQLVGPDYVVDKKKFTVTGPLVTGGVDTGVKVQVRAGGPAIGFQQVSQQMYLDKEVMLGQINTDEAVRYSRTQPTLGVVSPLEVSPFMIMWDPATYPEFNTITDIGQTDTKVLYYKGDTYMEYLTGAGILRKSQIDGGYDGTPARFVGEKGKIAQAGFATSEPYIYRYEIPQWGKQVEIALVGDTGYPIYPQVLSIRSDEKNQLAPCLRKLVPIIQQAQIDFINKPEETNRLVLELVDKYNNGWQYSSGLANFAITQMKALGIVDNGPNRTLGDFDMSRVQQLIDITTPIFRAQKTKVREGVRPQDIATNEFIDPAVGMTGR